MEDAAKRAAKQALRTRLKGIVVCNKTEKDAAITANILSLAAYRNAFKVFLYRSLPEEPDTGNLIQNAFQTGKRVFVPVTDKEIRFAEIQPETVFIKGKYGVSEPQRPFLIEEAPDIVFVPMVAYDKKKGRLGHGAGYYDRYLKAIHTQKIGICYSDFEAEDVFMDSFDVGMDKIITDKGILE